MNRHFRLDVNAVRESFDFCYRNYFKGDNQDECSVCEKCPFVKECEKLSECGHGICETLRNEPIPEKFIGAVEDILKIHSDVPVDDDVIDQEARRLYNVIKELQNEQDPRVFKGPVKEKKNPEQAYIYNPSDDYEFMIYEVSNIVWGTFFEKDFMPCKMLNFAVYCSNDTCIHTKTITVNLRETSLDGAIKKACEITDAMTKEYGVQCKFLGWVCAKEIEWRGICLKPTEAYKQACLNEGIKVEHVYPY